LQAEDAWDALSADKSRRLGEKFQTPWPRAELDIEFHWVGTFDARGLQATCDA
jgi:hypothetical protein